MRYRKWFELLNDYDIEILYQLDEANIVADTLSRKMTRTSALIAK